MTNTSRATDASKNAAAIRKLLRKGHTYLAECGLEAYYDHYGPTPAYNRLYRDVALALYNRQKGGK